MQSNIKMQPCFLAILASALFLCNPIVGFVDVLPNCVGYLLLCIGLHQLSDLSGRISEAARRARILLLLALGSLLAAYLIYGVMGQQTAQMNRYEQSVYILLASFVSLIAQWYFLIPAFRDLFAGIATLAERHAADALTRERQGRTYPERMRRATTRFVILSSLLSLLPELTILTSFEYEKENRFFPFDWYQYVNLFRFVCGFAAFLIGLIWLVRMLRFTLAAMRDREWLAHLREQYCAEVLPQTGMLTVRRFSTAFLLLQIALIFSASLRLNQRSILPGLIFAVLAGLAICLLRADLPRERCMHCFLAAAALGLGSAVRLVVEGMYFKRYLPEASLYDPDAYRAFLLVRLTEVGEILLTFLLIAVLLRTMASLTRTHTEVDYGGQNARYLSADATARLHRQFAIRASVTVGIFFLAALLGALEAWLRLDYPWLWIPSLLCSVAGIWSAWSFFFELKEQVQYRYHSDGVNKAL